MYKQLDYKASLSIFISVLSDVFWASCRALHANDLSQSHKKEKRGEAGVESPLLRHGTLSPLTDFLLCIFLETGATIALGYILLRSLSTIRVQYKYSIGCII